MRSAQGPIDETLEWLTILVTPPELAGGSMQAAELELFGDQQWRGVEGQFDDEALADLTRSGWLRQDVQVRGSYLSTVGLRARLDHPELAMLNVPGGAVDWIAETFHGIAAYLEEFGARFGPGEVYLDENQELGGVFTFATLEAEAAASIGLENAEPAPILGIPLP